MAKMRATFITMFKEPIRSWLDSSIIGRAHKKGILTSEVVSILEEVSFDHHAVDDTPYGGGPGELMRIDIIEPLIKKTLAHNPTLPRSQKRVLLMDPAGVPFTQEHARRLAGYGELIFIAGRYEGIDARIHHYVDEALSVGDFVLSGGDIAAMAMCDATVRMIEGVLGNSQSAILESHYNGRLEASHYTRPKTYEGHEVPDVYCGGHHHEINKALARESIYRTSVVRPDLLEKYPPDEVERAVLDSLNATRPTYPWMKTHG